MAADTENTQQIIDLADLCAAPKPVAIRGVVFTVPGAPTLEWQWTFDELHDRVFSENAGKEDIDLLRDHLVKLLCVEDASREEEARAQVGTLDLRAMVLAARGLYGDLNPALQEASTAPPTRAKAKRKPAGGTRSTSRNRSRNGSRSST